MRLISLATRFVVQEEKEEKRAFDEWVETQCTSMKYIPGKDSDDMTCENVRFRRSEFTPSWH